MTRGLVLPLTAEQRVVRMRFLAGLEPGSALDPHVRAPASWCMPFYYLLSEHNGGKDPTAPDPADRWSKPGSEFVNRTSDCIGAQAWCGGWDRYQPVRFAHLYEGWINTDSMMLDARGPRRCFMPVARPMLGDYVVCASGSRGHRVGHIGGIIGAPLEWDPARRDCWSAIAVVDCAARTGQANAKTTALGWFDTGALFVRPVMQP